MAVVDDFVNEFKAMPSAKQKEMKKQLKNAGLFSFDEATRRLVWVGLHRLYRGGCRCIYDDQSRYERGHDNNDDRCQCRNFDSASGHVGGLGCRGSSSRRRGGYPRSKPGKLKLRPAAPRAGVGQTGSSASKGLSEREA
jgi:hypothetical protein